MVEPAKCFIGSILKANKKFPKKIYFTYLFMRSMTTIIPITPLPLNAGDDNTRI